MAKCLDQAKAMAKDDIVKQRLQFFAKTFGLTQLLTRNYWAGQQIQALIEKNAPIEEVAKAMRGMVDTMAAIDVDTYFKDAFANDPVAYFPPLNGWFTPLKGGAATNATRYFASAIANEAVAMARADQNVSGETIRKHINDRVTAIFGTDGSESYKATVARMRDMALKLGAASKLAEPVKVDGVLDEPVWKSADVLSNFVIWGGTGKAEEKTQVRLAHDGKNLYVALECFQDTSNLVAESPERDGSTWKDDSVEMFVSRDMNAVPFAQFIINAKGAFFDQFDQNGQDDYATRLAYNFDASWKSKVYPDKWTAEVRIPLKELGVDPAKQPLLRMNFVRNAHVGNDMHISAWFSSLRAHADPLSRGWVLFE
jgi:hypothetical protein